jgi:hypothetical protein
MRTILSSALPADPVGLAVGESLLRERIVGEAVPL